MRVGLSYEGDRMGNFAKVQYGFSLMELMVSIAISTVLALGTAFVVAQQVKFYRGQKMVVDTQSDLRMGMEVLQSDLMMAGYGIGKQDAFHLYTSEGTVHGVNIGKSKDRPHGNLVVSRAYGLPYTIVSYSLDATVSPKGQLHLCRDLSEEFIDKKDFKFVYASMMDQSHHDYLTMKIDGINAHNGCPVASCGTSKCTQIDFTYLNPTSTTAGVWLNDRSPFTDYSNGTFFPDFRVVTYHVSTNANPQWPNPDGRKILWRSDGIEEVQPLIEHVEGFQIDFEHRENRTSVEDCGDSYVRDYPAAKDGCGVRARHAFLSLVVRTEREDRILPSYTPISIATGDEIQNAQKQCFPEDSTMNCTNQDGFQRRALTSHILVRNSFWRDEE